MKFWPFRREVRGVPSVENPTVPVSAHNFLAFFGVGGNQLPHVTLESALTVPAVLAAVSFLSQTLANLPLHVYKSRRGGETGREDGRLQRIFNEAPNGEWSSFRARTYFWQQVFTCGRGLMWVEKGPAGQVLGLWPLDASQTLVTRQGGKVFFTYAGKTYPAADVIDIPFMLKDDQLQSRSPIAMGAKAIQQALAMGDYGSNFFAGGGVPPLSMEGPMPAGVEAMKRAMSDVRTSITAAKESGSGIFTIPPGYKLQQVGFDPAKGQMVEGRLFQIQEIARVWGLPPVFLMDLSHGTFTNTEQQDLQLSKHVISPRAKALEDEINLKAFGPTRNATYVEHSLDGLMRGDLLARMDALARAVNSALLMPDEARALDNRPPAPGGNRLYMQGATVPLEAQIAAPPADPNATDPTPADPQAAPADGAPQ